MYYGLIIEGIPPPFFLVCGIPGNYKEYSVRKGMVRSIQKLSIWYSVCRNYQIALFYIDILPKEHSVCQTIDWVANSIRYSIVYTCINAAQRMNLYVNEILIELGVILC
jgi:hypothetical protein